jgi:hypothetical protein
MPIWYIAGGGGRGWGGGGPVLTQTHVIHQTSKCLRLGAMPGKGKTAAAGAGAAVQIGVAALAAAEAGVEAGVAAAVAAAGATAGAQAAHRSAVLMKYAARCLFFSTVMNFCATSVSTK